MIDVRLLAHAKQSSLPGKAQQRVGNLQRPAYYHQRQESQNR